MCCKNLLLLFKIVFLTQFNNTIIHLSNGGEEVERIKNQLLAETANFNSNEKEIKKQEEKQMIFMWHKIMKLLLQN